jgi:hypothetical protein
MPVCAWRAPSAPAARWGRPRPRAGSCRRAPAPGIAAVVQVGHQRFVDDALAQRGVAHRPGHLDAAEHVAAHPVGAAEVQHLVGSSPAPQRKYSMRECSRKRPTTDRTRMRSVRPAAPAAACRRRARAGRPRHRPAQARTSGVDQRRVGQALTLTTTRAGCPARAAAATCPRCRSSRRCSANGAISQVARRPHAGLAGQLLEHRVGVGRQRAVGGEGAQVGVQPRRARVVVAGGQVQVAPQPARPRVASGDSSSLACVFRPTMP